MASPAMGFVDVLPRGLARAAGRAATALPDVAIVEDEPRLGEVAAQVCAELGLRAAVYSSPAAFLSAFGHIPPPLVILDWRFQREVGAAAFMALRHRFGDVPIVCWTGMPLDGLPVMVASDRRTRIVRKAGRLDEFESALRWALASADDEEGAST